MAKVMNPLNSTEARGKDGGIVYNRNAGGNYVKAFASPTQPRTTKQLNIRAFMQKATRRWQLLTATQRSDWGIWAGNHPVIDWTGNSVTLSGFNAFCALAARSLFYNYTIADDVPAAAAPDAITGAAAADGVGSISLTWTATAGTTIVAGTYYQKLASAGRAGSRAKAKFYDAFTGEGGVGSIPNLSPGSYAVWMYAVRETDGQISPAILLTVAVT